MERSNPHFIDKIQSDEQYQIFLFLFCYGYGGYFYTNNIKLYEILKIKHKHKTIKYA